MSDKKTYKSFKEFAKDYLKEYDDANFTGVGGFSIGSMDAIKPIASLGSTDSSPAGDKLGDKRGTTVNPPQKRIKKKKDRFQRLERLKFTTKKEAQESIKDIIESDESPIEKLEVTKIMVERTKILSERAVNKQVKSQLIEAHQVFLEYINTTITKEIKND